MKFTNICSKEVFSLKNRKINKKITFNLCETYYNNKVKYGIQIVSGDDFNVNDQVIKDISDNKEFVENIISYLDQNGVDEISFKDVIHDLLFEIESNKLKNLIDM